MIKNLCVFCGSSNMGSDVHKQAAADLGKLMAENGLRLIYGGGRTGLMGIVADSVLAHGGEAVGVGTKYLEDKELAHGGCTELIIVEDMHARKQMMFDRSDAFCVLPGGIGTLDEIYEVLGWKQIGTHTKQIIFVDVDGYWREVDKTLHHVVTTGYAPKSTLDLYEIVPGVQDVIPAIVAYKPPVIQVQEKWKPKE